jgi:hypothetical protein
MVGFANTDDSPREISTMKTSSRRMCPVAMSGPTRQPRRGASETIAAVTGPGEITAPIETANAKAMISRIEEVGMSYYCWSVEKDFTVKCITDSSQ